MATPRRLFVDTDFGQMHLRISRSQKAKELPLVCLHMTPQSSRYFSTFMKTMSSDRDVVAPDYHGYGESDLPPQEPPVKIKDYAHTIWQALDSLQIRQVALLGHHTGSKVAVEMAYQRPDAVANIVLVSALLLSQEETSGAERGLPVLDESGARFTKLWQSIKAHQGPNVSLDVMASSFAEAIRNTCAADWGYQAASAYNRKFSCILSSLNQRVVVINPGDDLFEFTPRLAKYLRNGIVIDKPEWGHGLWDTFTDDVAAAVRAALDVNNPEVSSSAVAFATT